MQKKIIALAIAGLASTAAFAQTNVTIYGIADAYVGYINGNGGTNTGTLPGVEKHGRDTVTVGSGGLAGSRLGFKGTEDLGNGLKAVFVLEYGLDLVNDTGVGAAGAPAARQQYVGLNGGFGTLSMGRQYAPGYYASANDAHLYAATSAKRQSQAFLGGTIVGLSNARWDNSINYVTNNLGGFTAQVIYQGGASANEIGNRESYGIGANYVAGPVAVNYVYQNSTTGGNVLAGAAVPTGTVPGANVRKEEHYIGGSFDAKVVKVFASFQTMDQGNRAAAGNGNKGHAYDIGAQIPMGKSTIAVGYSLGDRNNNPRGPALGTTGNYRGQIETVTGTFLYSLSKRSTLYTSYMYSDSDVQGAGGVTNMLVAGINHAF